MAKAKQFDKLSSTLLTELDRINALPPLNVKVQPVEDDVDGLFYLPSQLFEPTATLSKWVELKSSIVFSGLTEKSGEITGKKGSI